MTKQLIAAAKSRVQAASDTDAVQLVKQLKKSGIHFERTVEIPRNSATLVVFDYAEVPHFKDLDRVMKPLGLEREGTDPKLDTRGGGYVLSWMSDTLKVDFCPDTQSLLISQG